MLGIQGARGWTNVLGGWGVALVAMGACSSGDDDGNSAVRECLACAEDECPSETQACDESAVCDELRTCGLNCASGDKACQNRCTEKAAQDTAAITKAASLLACAWRTCPDVCGGSSSQPGVGGANAGPGGGNSSVGGATGSGGSTRGGAGGVPMGVGGSSSPALYCQDLLEWSTGCAVDLDEPFRSCRTAPPPECRAGCYLDATCQDYEDMKAGETNELWACLTACDLATGTQLMPTCANAKAKRYLCGETVEIPCSDADPVDRCLSKCVLDYACDQWEPRMGGEPTAFQNCYNGCEASVGISSPNFVVGEGGYVETSSWHGYAWTSTDGKSSSTITPADFATLPAGRQLCVSGTVAGTADYSAAAMLGFNLSQQAAPPGEEAPLPGTWGPGDDIGNGGIFFNITNRSSTPLRIQLQGPDGDTDPTQRWCADVVGQSEDIFWHTFNTECWEGGSGTAYNGIDALESIMVLVPGGTTARSFDFCIYEILEK
ncbi:MAG TPA: hypothetical protein VIM73_19945 [Polyangiaceae bacterium]